MFQKRATLRGGFVGMLVVGAVVTAGLVLAQHRAQGLYDALPTRIFGIVLDTDDNDTAIVWSRNGTVHERGITLERVLERSHFQNRFSAPPMPDLQNWAQTPGKTGTGADVLGTLVTYPFRT